jgi:hypothetical protein
MLVFIYFRNLTLKKALFAVVFLFSIFFLGLLSYLKIEDIKIRVDDTYFGIVNPIIENGDYKKVNLSTYAILANAYVTKCSLQEHPFTGSGLGSHKEIFYKHLPKDAIQYSDLQSGDAASLALRLLSELGLIGFLSFMYFVIKFKIKWHSYYSLIQEKFWVINSGIVFMILLFLLRSGDYTFHARTLFFMIYYYSWKKMDKIKS